MLVGRNGPLSSLRAALEQCALGRGTLAVVSGEAGIGKTALVTALTDEAAQAGAVRVTVGRAWEHGDAPAYFPVWSWLRALDIDPADVTPAAPRAGQADRPAVEGAFFVWERVLSALARAASSRLELLVLEDAHAADVLTLELLAFLATSIRSLPVLLLVTTRPSDPRMGERARSLLARLRRDGLDLPLSPLDEADVGLLAEQRARGPLSAATRARLVEITAGNPLFVVECARAIGAGGRQAHERLLTVPPSIRDLVEARVGALPDETVHALRAGAVLGRDFSAATVARMSDTLPARVIDALLPALRVGLVTETAPGRFFFAHEIVRAAIEDALPSAVRARLHGDASSALAPLGDAPDVLARRARHALSGAAAGDGRAIARLCERAADVLVVQGAFDRAHALAARMAEARDAGLLPAATPEQLLRAADIARAAGRHAESRALSDQVIASARAAGDHDLFARAVLLVGADLRPGIVDGQLARLLEEALATRQERDATWAMLLARLAAALQPAPDPAVPIDMARRAIAAARALSDEPLLVSVLYTAGSALVDFASMGERTALATELLERATATGDHAKALRARARLAMDRLEAGDFAAFGEDVERMLEASASLGHPRHRWRPLLFASMRALFEGNPDASERCLVEVTELSHLTDDPALGFSLTSHRMFRARLLHRDDEIAQAAAGLPALVGGIPQGENIATTLRAAMLARLEDRDGAARELAGLCGGRERYVESDGSFRAALAEAYAFAGDDEQRRRMRAVLAPRVDEELLTGHVPYTYEGPAERVLGLLDASLGDTDAALAHLRRARARVAARGHRLFVAQLDYDLARVLALAGDTTEARRHARDASALAEELGMTGLVTRAARIAGAAPEDGSVRPQAARRDARTFRLSATGDTWRVEHDGGVVHVKDCRGVRLLARLVQQAGQEVHVLALAADEGGGLVETSAGEHLDARAMRAYRERITALSDDLADAEARGDARRAEACERERELLAKELARATGLGGDARRAGSATERARVNVQRRLRDAVGRIAAAAPELGWLEHAVRTGTYCSFRA